MNRPSVPSEDPWTLAVHRSDTGFTPAGTAVAISARRALTCAHVVLDDFDGPGSGRAAESLWVSFPKVTSLWKVRRRVARVEYDTDDPQTADVAVLHLAEDMPAAVEPARLKLLDPAVLAGRRWWAFGFPASSRRNGSEATGTVGARLAHGWVRLDVDAGVSWPVEKGFSGGGLWVPEYDAVAGIVGQAVPSGDRRGDAQALTLAQADVFLPDAKLRVQAGWSAPDAGASAMASWGWQLHTDPEAGRHWRPRSRGVTTEYDRGYRFQGRTAALREIVGWLDRPVPDARVLVVTGSPGVGKSAVLGRIVATADRRLRAELPPGDDGVVASPGAVGCAVHVKGKTALEVAREIARAAGAVLPERAEDVVGVVRDVLEERPGRFNVVVDAVDEAATGEDARAVLAAVVLPLVQSCGRLGAQVVCGSRRADSAGDLLRVLDGAAVEIDLDLPAYFTVGDLEAYTAATLRLIGAERPGNPYEDPAVAWPVARRIAALAEPNFLIAGLEARRRGLYDETAADPAGLTLTATVDAALSAYLGRVPPVGGVSGRDLLTVLAYAEAPGWTPELWHIAAAALGNLVSPVDLERFARSAAASFLVETSTAAEASTFRLFHQALNDALLRDRSAGGIRFAEQQIARAFMAFGRDRGWGGAPAYLLRALPGHADRAGLIDELLADDDYLLHADLSRLLEPANHATTSEGRRSARTLHLTLQASNAEPAHRAAMFTITQALEGFPITTTDQPMPYRARWAATHPRAELRRLDGHTGAVVSVCAVTVEGRSLLASAGYDRHVRLWDPSSGTEVRRLNGHTNWVNAVCAVNVAGRAVLASAGYDRAVWLWDPDTGAELRRIEGHTGSVNAVCAVTVNGATVLASASNDRSVRLWDPGSGAEVRRLKGHTNWVNAVCAVNVGGQTVLASASTDKSVRLWDPGTGAELRRLDGHTDSVKAVCAVNVNGRVLLASAGYDGSVRLWDPGSGAELRRLKGYTSWVDAVDVDGRTLLASAGYDGSVRLWNPGSGAELRRLKGHTNSVSAVCAVPVDGRTLLASAGYDKSVRLWDPGTDAELHRLNGHTDRVNAICTVTSTGRTLLASAGNDRSVRLWDPGSGAEVRVLGRHTSWVNAVCAITADGATLLASAGIERSVRLWDPATGTELRLLSGHTGWVNAMCAVTVDGRPLLASASTVRSVLLWDPSTGVQLRSLNGHTDRVKAVCVAHVDGRPLLASGSQDRSVRLWDPGTGTELRRLQGHTGWVNAVCAVNVDGRTLLASAGNDRSVRLWDLGTGAELRRLDGHTDSVNAVCAVNLDGRTLLASAGNDESVRLWDPSTGRHRRTIPVHHPATACLSIDGTLVVALDVGVLAIDLV
ncbi:hypothetical protein [Catenuloplanes atrovinosus]|uniref:WD40 repeat protein n=1 Tax=Catenuloplanes atrovinosus TaxID=137266 RepID=A0AAE3YLC2_9ACTN|nr:hypothetical protein [Catenuloplanes atrovinosus]MDR7275615.1 WD40 repeat protein [Catenuloplanes atrovinosus]